MTNRIPPSLNWLINKRARLAGEMIRTKKALYKVQDLVNKLKYLEQSLEAIDSSLKLHEIQIDVENIKPIKSQTYQMKFPNGYINRYVMDYLISRAGDSPVPTSDIVKFLIDKHYEYDDKQLPYTQVSRAVAMALSRLFRKGSVVKYHPTATTLEGKWGLSKELIAIHSPNLLDV